MKAKEEIRMIWRAWGRLFLHAKSEWRAIMHGQKESFATQEKLSNRNIHLAHWCFPFPILLATLLCGFFTGTFYGETNVQEGIMRALAELLIYGGAYAILWYALPPIAERFLPALDRRPIRVTIFFVFPFMLVVEMAVRVIPGFDLLYLLDAFAIYWVLESVKANEEIYEEERMKALMIMVGGLVLSVLAILLVLVLCLPRV